MTSRRVRGAVVAGVAVVLVAVAAVVWLRRDDGSGGDFGRDGWVRTGADPAALAVSGAGGGPLRTVTRPDGEDGGPLAISPELDERSAGGSTVLDGSDGGAMRPFAVAAEGTGDRWLVVAGDGWDLPLTAWSSVDRPTAPDGDAARRAPAVELPDSVLGTSTVAAAIVGGHQVVAASDADGGEVAVWTRRGTGPWERSAIDPLESARSAPGPQPSLIRALRLVRRGDHFLLAAVAGDPAILSVWASEPFPEDGPVSGWQRTAEDVDGEPACTITALHESPAGVLLGWAPLGPDGCRDQEELRFALVAEGGVEHLPTLDPQAGETIVSDAVALADGTTIAVGSRGDPPHSATDVEDRVPALWIRPAGEEWDPEPVGEPALSSQLDQVATVVSVDPRRGVPSVDAVDELLVVAQSYDADTVRVGGTALWSWARDDGDGD